MPACTFPRRFSHLHTCRVTFLHVRSAATGLLLPCPRLRLNETENVDCLQANTFQYRRFSKSSRIFRNAVTSRSCEGATYVNTRENSCFRCFSSSFALSYVTYMQEYLYSIPRYVRYFSSRNKFRAFIPEFL